MDRRTDVGPDGTALMGLTTFIGNLNPGTELANITSRLVTGQPGAWDGEKAKLAFVKGFVASGDWKDHPAEAFFETAINVASLPISWSKLGKVGDVSRITAETSGAARAAAEAGKAGEALRLARAAARGTDRIALPTVDGWKALDKGAHLDTAWAKNIDKIDVDIKVPDQGVKADRPNVPHDDAGAPTVHEAPAARPDGQSSDPGPAVVSGRGTREPVLVGAPERAGSAKADVSAARPLDADTAGPRVRTDGTETAEVAKTGATSRLGHDASLDTPPQPVRDSAPGVTHGHGDSPLARDHSNEGGSAGHSRTSSDGLRGTDHPPFEHAHAASDRATASTTLERSSDHRGVEPAVHEGADAHPERGDTGAPNDGVHESAQAADTFDGPPQDGLQTRGRTALTKESVEAGAKPGDDPTPETIRQGTVRMEDHPHYDRDLQSLRAQGFEIVKTTDSPAVVNRRVVDVSGRTLRYEQEVRLQSGMRYLDLEHELSHVEQISDVRRFPDGPPVTEIVHDRMKGGDPKTKNLADPRLLVEWQNSVAEYHVRLNEVLRLSERGVSPGVLDDHLNGLELWRTEYQEALKNAVRSRTKRSWLETRFFDIEELARLVQIIRPFSE